MIFVESLFAYFAATKRGWGWYVILPLAVDILCFLLIISAQSKLVWVVGYLGALLTLGLMLTFPKQKILPVD